MSIPGSTNPLLLFGDPTGGQYQIQRSLRFNSSDSGYLSRTPASAGNRRTFTYSVWVKRTDLSSNASLYTASSTYGDEILFYNSSIRIAWDGAFGGDAATVAVFRDPSAWYHVVVAVDTTQATDTNRLKVYVNDTQQTLTAGFYGGTYGTYPAQNYQTAVSNTVAQLIGKRPDPTYASFYLADIHFIDGQALTPSSFTEVSATTGQLIPKAYTGSFGTNGFWLKFSDNSAATAAALGNDYSGNNNDWTPNNLSVTQGTGSYTTNTTGTFAANRGAIKAFNGATSGSDFFAQPADGNTVTIGSLGITGITKLRMWLGKNNSGDPWGTLSLDATNVTSFLTTNYPSLTSTGQWIDLTSQLSGSSLSTITMTSPVANTDVRLAAVEVNDIVLIDRAAPVTAGNDSLVDTPTSFGTDTSAGGEVRGNYCTANPLATTTSLTLSNGNLQVVGGLVGGATYRGNSTIGVASGKWYFETTFVSVGDNTAVGIGQSNIIDQYPGQDALSYAYVFEPAVRINSNSQVSYGSALIAGDVFMCAFDLDNNKIFFGKNGTWFGSSVPASGTNPAYTLSAGTYTPIFRPQKNSGTCEIQFNFGQRPFAHPAPSGFKALVDTNLTAPVVAKPNTVMDVLTYTGNGANRSISGLQFAPDFVWIKGRSFAGSHLLYNSVVGPGPNKAMQSDNTNAEGGAFMDNSTYGYLTSFDSTGFSVVPGSSPTYVNTNGSTYVAWTWDAGTSTVTNTQGSITSQVRANASAGFSVVTFNSGGSNGEFSVGHGLGVAPRLIIMKSRTRNGGPWWVHHLSATDTTTKYLQLSATAAVLDNGGSGSIWGAALPTSTVFGFSVGVGRAHLQNEDIVSYCFAPVVGYSAMGSYVGNGSSDGVFVYTGFRPKFLMIKRTNNTSSWMIRDTARDPYNVASADLYANLSIAEGSYAVWDLLSNGFKARGSAGDVNGAGDTYIYFAFAESPFQYARAR